VTAYLLRVKTRDSNKPARFVVLLSNTVPRMRSTKCTGKPLPLRGNWLSHTVNRYYAYQSGPSALWRVYPRSRLELKRATDQTECRGQVIHTPTDYNSEGVENRVTDESLNVNYRTHK